MKKASLVLGIAGPLALLLSINCDSGDGNGGNGTSGVDCSATCDKAISCNPDEGPKDGCVDGCEGSKKMLQAGPLDGIVACINECTPGTDDVTEKCMEEVASTCTAPSNLDAFAQAICTWMIDCVEGIPEDQKAAAIAQCKTSFTTAEGAEMMKCFSSSALTTLQNCVTKKTCAEQETAIESCMESEFGIKAE